MKILATSDLHGQLEEFGKAVAKEKPEIVVLAGDVTERSGDDLRRAAKVWNALWDLCKSPACKGTHFVVVPGNHDYESQTVAMVMSMRLDNFHFLDRHDEKPTEIRGIRFFGGEKNKPEKLKRVKGKADIVVFHYNPTKGDDRMAVVEGMDPDLVIYGHHHKHTHWEHVERQAGEMLKINVSTWVGKGGEYGYYLIDYVRGGVLSADWHPVK